MNHSCRSCGIRMTNRARLEKKCLGCVEIEAETYQDEIDAVRIELTFEALSRRDKNGKD